MKCCVDDCDNEAKHRYHRRLPNEYFIDQENGIAFIIIYDNYGEFKNKVTIDVEDLEKISKYKWNIGSNGYCRCSALMIDLHRFLLNLNEFDGDYVDHINGDKLDNRKSNLRIVTSQLNQFNSHNKGSGNNIRKGVSFRKDRNKWRAYITIDGKQINLGTFNTENEAIEARIKAEENYFKEYRRIDD